MWLTVTCQLIRTMMTVKKKTYRAMFKRQNHLMDFHLTYKNASKKGCFNKGMYSSFNDAQISDKSDFSSSKSKIIFLGTFSFLSKSEKMMFKLNTLVYHSTPLLQCKRLDFVLLFIPSIEIQHQNSFQSQQLAGPPLVVVPVVPRNHRIFQKALRNHRIFENISLEHTNLCKIWLL